MKSDSSARKGFGQLSPEAFQAFFEALEHPAALCDGGLRLLATNPAFEALIGMRGAIGENLGELLEEIAANVPAEGSANEVEIQLDSGQSVTLTLSRRGDAIAVLARNLSQAVAGGSLAAAGRLMIEQARTERVLLEVGREVAGARSEEALVAAMAHGMKGLFPGRAFCIRIIDPRSLELTSLYAEGKLRDGAQEPLIVKRGAAQKTQLETAALDPKRIKLIDGELPLVFHGTVRAISAPLVATGNLFGVINVEYPEGLSADLITDDRVLVQLANQVAVGIRNVKLIDELTFVRKYLEELLERANALILVTSRERRVLVFNQLLSKLTGHQKEDVLGGDLLSFFPESERMRVNGVFSSGLKGEAVPHFETRLLCRGGEEIRASFATSSVRDAQGQVELVIAVGQDLTAVKELEQQVIHAEKLASLGQLAASVVHEINNPMTAVAAYADALLQKARATLSGDPRDSDKLKKILDNSQRILRFTKDLVSYARPAQDRPEKVDLHTVLDLAVSFCDHVLAQHGITVQRVYGELPEIAGVKGNLVQVFVNLITNACHAMRPGGTVRLATTCSGDEILVRVEDSGTGIQPKHLSRIFEPFFTTKADGKGTGLGLSIVQSIVEKHGGDVRVESTVGVGTSFVIRLPVSRA